MSSPEIILYDLPSKPPCKSWSANALKARIALNHKEIPYKTEWVPYTRLASTLSATGLQPNEKGPGYWADYTVPALRMADGTMVMDSMNIAHKLEEIKPEPSLVILEDLVKEANSSVGAIFIPMVAEFATDLPDLILVDEDVEWFKEDRKKRFGLSLEEMKSTRGGEQAWQGAIPGFQRLEELLREHKRDEGPFILGSTASYTDFVILGFVEMIARIGGQPFERFLDQADGLRAFYEAGKKWCETK